MIATCENRQESEAKSAQNTETHQNKHTWTTAWTTR